MPGERPPLAGPRSATSTSPNPAAGSQPPLSPRTTRSDGGSQPPATYIDAWSPLKRTALIIGSDLDPGCRRCCAPDNLPTSDALPAATFT
jgi:hypothetical protein